MIFPEDGSVPSKREANATIFLEPAFVYLMCLFDKDFLIFLGNSLIVQRSCLRISQSKTVIEIKVRHKNLIK